MFSKSLTQASSLVCALLLASPAVASVISKKAAEICYNETSALYCYDGPNDTPQDITVSDILTASSYLRRYAKANPKANTWIMNTTDAADCGEWSVVSRGTVLVTAKHIDSTLNSAVLISDIANTLDGGASATPAQQAASIYGCGTSGGSLGTQVNLTDPYYYSAAYNASNLSPYGIIIKVVSNLAASSSAAKADMLIQ